MQPYPYAPYSNSNGRPVPVGYVAAVPYQTNATQRSRQPPLALHPPPKPMMVPVVFPTALQPMQHRLISQPQPYPYAQGYYYHTNAPNGINNPGVFVSNSKTTTKEVGKKGANENKTNGSSNALDDVRKQGLKGLTDNVDVNELLKHNGTKLKVSKIYRISKSKPGFANDSSDDEDKQLPLSPSRIRTKKPSTVPRSLHQLTITPSVSCCSTCSDCSECNYKNDKHVYDDCPQCRAAYRPEQAQNRRQKRK